MTKFEQIGINIQLSAINKADALKKFNHSCNVCCHKGMHIDCDRCAISATHSSVIAVFDDQSTKEDSQSHA